MTRPGPRAAPLLLAAGLSAGCAAPPPEELLDFAGPSEAAALASGWSGFERTGDGTSFAWAVGRTSTLRLGPAGRGPRTISFRAWAFEFPGAGPQDAVVLVNGCRVGELRLGGAPSEFSVATPWSVWRDDGNVLTFAWSRADAPRARVPGATDDRLLSAGFDWIRVAPAAVRAERASPTPPGAPGSRPRP